MTGRAKRRAIDGEATDRLRVVLGERAHSQRRPLGEFSEPAAQNAASVGEQAHGHADPRRKVHPLDDAVPVEPEAQLEAQPAVDAPTVLGEQRELGRGDLWKRRQRGVGNPLGQRAVDPEDVDAWLKFSPSNPERCRSKPILNTCWPAPACSRSPGLQRVAGCPLSAPGG